MQEVIFVNEFTNGILDPREEMFGKLKDGGTIVAATAPGCWGPMITPELKGGHEVTKPVYIDGAEVGDSVAIYIKSIDILSEVVASGSDAGIENRADGDGFIAARCPECNTLNPRTKLEGIGPESVRCGECGAEIAPFMLTNGYTIAFDEDKNIGLTLNKDMAEKAAKNARDYMAIPDNSIQNPIVTFMPHDLVGTASRLRPFVGQLGTTPSAPMPDSHNAGDFGTFLLDAPHDYKMTKEELDEHRTDGHMDINKVRAGAIVIAPVKVEGAGVYVGDAHAMQGAGEIAGHTADVSAVVTLKVKVLKGLNIDGPIVLPVEEDLPYLAKPFNKEEKRRIKRLAKNWNMDKKEIEKVAPISFVGSGGNLNEAIDNALARGGKVLDMEVEEVMNRATISGSVEIGRYPGTSIVTFLAPVKKLKKAGLYKLVKEQYNL